MDRPNILIIMTDQQRGDSVLPENPTPMPNVEQLGREGVTFAQTYCNSPHCCPSRASFFSGLYPSMHGIWNNVLNGMAINKEMNDGVRLWSDDLLESGYDLHFLGKWHVCADQRPEDFGWKEYENCTTAVGGKDYHGWTWENYNREGIDSSGASDNVLRRPGYGDFPLYFSNGNDKLNHDDFIHENALRVLRERKEQATPWAMYVGFTSPHDPFQPKKEYLERIPLDAIELPESYEDSLADKPKIYQRMRRQVFDQVGPEGARKAIRHYRAYCAEIDDHVGELMATLEEIGQADNTIVIFCSDHGDYCGEHGLFAKGIPCFQGAYHVPMVVRWPTGVMNPGRRVDAFVSLTDIAPTLLDLANVKTDRYFTGESLRPFMNDEMPSGWRDDIHTQCNGVELYFTQRSVMTKEYKYVFNGFDQDELYDLTSDPAEMINLADRPEYQEIKKEMCRRMWRFAKRENDAMINPYLTVALAPWGPALAFEK